MARSPGAVRDATRQGGPVGGRVDGQEPVRQEPAVVQQLRVEGVERRHGPEEGFFCTKLWTFKPNSAWTIYGFFKTT